MKKLYKFFSALFLSIPLFACGQDFTVSMQQDSLALPLTYRSGANPIVMLKVNDRGPYKFMFDTGSPGLLKLDAQLFNELGLKVTDSIRAGDGSGRNVQVLPITRVDKADLGGFIIRNAEAMARNYNQRQGLDRIDGVIGLTFFRDHLVELNFEKNLLIVTKGSLKNPGAAVLYAVNGVPATMIKVGGEFKQAVFDTGNMGGITFHGDSLDKKYITGTPRVIGQAQTVANKFDVLEAQLNTAVTLGNVVSENPLVVLNNVLPHTNLGIRYLKQFNLTFDQRNRRFSVHKFDREGIPAANQAVLNNASEYAGKYGDRTITVDAGGNLFIQRPGGMLLKLVQLEKDFFGLEQVPGAAIRFERNEKNAIVAISASRDKINWEKAARNTGS